VGNKNISMKDFTRLVLKIADLEGRISVKLPVPLLEAASSIMTLWSDYISHRPPLSIPVEVAYSSNYLYFDTTKAQEELGLTFNPIDKSLYRALEWFRKHGYIS